MPMTKPDGSLDISSLLSHISLLEQTVEGELKTQLKTALTDLAAAQSELRITRDELTEVKSDVKANRAELESDLKLTQTELAVVKSQLSSQCQCNTTRTQSPSDITKLKTDVSGLQTDIFHLQSLHNSSGGGATFTRWGRTTCPPGNKMIYKGYTGGTHYSDKASSATVLCLPETPLYASHTEGAHNAYIYGTEYEIYSDNVMSKYNDEDTPCVVCESKVRRSVIMVPARNQCYPGWNLEYWGYLMGGRDTHASNEYVCVDKDLEIIPGGGADNDGHRLYIVEGRCGSLPCLPYVNNWELTCSVCTQ